MELALRYGREGIAVQVPDANVRYVLRFRPFRPLEPPRVAVTHALRNPRGCPPLRELARGKGDVCVVTSDITRPVPNAIVLPPILEELEAAGVTAERVTILIATGSHRPNTTDELHEMLGDEVMGSGAAVVNHNAFASEELLPRGHTRRGTPVLVNRLYAEADLRVSVALVEPHLIAGFSGGRKAICPGIVGIETILSFHAPPLVQPDEACAGLLDGNPAHEEALEAAIIAGAPELTVNVVLDEQRRMTGLFVGEMEAAHLAAVAHSLTQSKVAIPEPVDVAITTSAGYPLDLTFYQGIKGIAAPLRIMKPGGTIIVAHECAEGLGEPDLVRRIMEIDDLETYLPRVCDPSYFHMDQWHAQFMKVRRHVGEILNYSTGIPEHLQARCFVTPIASVEEGVELALSRHGRNASIAVLPEGPYVLPCLVGDPIHRLGCA